MYLEVLITFEHIWNEKKKWNKWVENQTLQRLKNKKQRIKIIILNDDDNEKEYENLGEEWMSHFKRFYFSSHKKNKENEKKNPSQPLRTLYFFVPFKNDKDKLIIIERRITLKNRNFFKFSFDREFFHQITLISFPSFFRLIYLFFFYLSLC